MLKSNSLIFIDHLEGRRIQYELKEDEAVKKFLQILQDNFSKNQGWAIFGILLNNSNIHYHESLYSSDEFLKELKGLTKHNIDILWGEPFSNGTKSPDNIISDAHLIELKSSYPDIWKSLYRSLFYNLVKSTDGEKLGSDTDIDQLVPGCLFFKVKERKKDKTPYVSDVVFDSFQTPNDNFSSIAPNLDEYRTFLVEYFEQSFKSFEFTNKTNLIAENKGLHTKITRFVLTQGALKGAEMLGENYLEGVGEKVELFLKAVLGIDF